MTARLRRRLSALEGPGAGQGAGSILWVQRAVIGMEDEEPTQARIGDVVLNREHNESGAEFVERVTGEALRLPIEGPGSMRVVMLEAPLCSLGRPSRDTA